jgi:hypothetical protein
MQVHIFRGEGRVFGCTEDSAGTNLPQQYGPWSAFKTVDTIRGEPHAGMDVDECLDDIETYGFHLNDAHVRVTEQAVRRD